MKTRTTINWIRPIFFNMALLLSLASCSTIEDITNDGTGTGQVKVSLNGIADRSEDSLTRSQRESVSQTQDIRLDDGLMMNCTLSPTTSATRSTSAMASTCKYRLAAYYKDGSIYTYKGSQVFTAGSESSTTPLELPVGSYKFVFYSFNNSTDPGAPDASGHVDVPAGVDLLHYERTGTVAAGEITSIPVTFEHEYILIKVVADAQDLVLNPVDASANNGVGRAFTSAIASLRYSYSATFMPGSGMLVEDKASEPQLSWVSGIGTKILTSSEVSAYVGDQTSFTINFSSVTFPGTTISTFTNVPITFDNSIQSGTRYTLTVKFRKLCGAYVKNSGSSGSWKAFQCWNLTGVQTVPSSADPFTPSYQINGAYWQWGEKDYTVPAPSATGSFANYTWNSTYNTDASAWNEGNNNDQNSIKNTNYDPCPSGYRVPSKNEWDNVMTYNTSKSVGSWNSSQTAFTSGIYIGNTITSSTLFLPAAGYFTNGGIFTNHDAQGYYWSSKSGASAYSFGSGTTSTTNTYNSASAMSIRCISTTGDSSSGQ